MRQLGTESASRTVVFDEFADQFGVLPLPGDGEGAGQDRRRNVSRPARSGVGVGDRIPHRVDRQRGRHLEFGRLLEFGHRAPVFRTADLGASDAERLGLPGLGFSASLVGRVAGSVETEVGQRIRPPHRPQVIVELGVLQPAAAGRRVQPFAGLRDQLDRVGEAAAEDRYPAALQQDTVDMQRLSQFPPVPLGMLPAFVGGLQSAAGQPGEAEIQPASRYVVRPGVSGDDGIGLAIPAVRSIARSLRRPGTPRLAPIVFWRCPVPIRWPAPGRPRGAATARPPTTARFRRRICRMPVAAATRRWSADSPPSFEAVQMRRSPAPTTEPTARAGRRHRARSRTGLAHGCSRYACSSARSAKSPSASPCRAAPSAPSRRPRDRPAPRPVRLPGNWARREYRRIMCADLGVGASAPVPAASGIGAGRFAA